MKEVVDKVRLVAVRALTRNVVSALENSTLQIEAQAMQFTNVQLPPIREESRAIAERFMTNLNDYFDALTMFKTKEEDTSDYDKLSLVDHDYLEVIIAMEGMVNHARNNDKQQYISFTTRLDSIFPNLTIDETNNPLDPEQIGDCFNESIRPLGLKAHYLLTIYREFNKAVFQNLEEVMAEANDVLIEIGVMPNLDVKARNRELAKQKREAERTAERAAAEAELNAAPRIVEERRPAPESSFAAEAPHATPAPAPSNKTEITRNIEKRVEQAKPEKSHAEMFAMMQILVKGLAMQQNGQSSLPVNIPVATPSGDTPNTDLQAENENLKQQQAKLMSVLNDLQNRISLGETLAAGQSSTGAATNINESISRKLEESSSSGGIGTIDVQSSDVINLVTLLYKAIWNDASLP